MTSNERRRLRVAFIHLDLGIGGAERLVVDVALGLQKIGHSVDIYTSHHDAAHCFEETRDGTLRVHYLKPPLPRSLRGKFHILFAHLRQLHLTASLLLAEDAKSKYDVFFVDQLSTCLPFLRAFAKKRVVFYCHFPDKLLADGDFFATVGRRRASVLKRLYRLPMDFLEEKTTGLSDVLLANSEFTAGVFNSFFSIPRKPRVVYPGINLAAYEAPKNMEDYDVQSVTSSRQTLLSLNRFEKKKNAALAIEAFALLKSLSLTSIPADLRLVLAGGYDPRLADNIETLSSLINAASSRNLRYWITSPSSSKPLNTPKSSASSASSADVILLLNFTTAQRSALLSAPSTRVLLYTPANEHFGIGPVEGMACGLPVLACDSGGPTESIVAGPPDERTGWLCAPNPDEWAKVLREEILTLSESQREAMSKRAKERVKEKFAMEAMAKGVEAALYDAVDMGPTWSPSFFLIFMVLVVISAVSAYVNAR